MELNRNSNSISGMARRYFQLIDVPLFATIVALCFLGVLNLYGIATGNYVIAQRQLIFVVVGIMLMVLGSLFNFRYLKNYSFPVLAVYVLSVVLLLLTFYSQDIRGVQAWIVIGQWTFEPVELAKLALIIVLAKYFSQRHVHIRQFRHIVASAVYTAIPAGIVMLQPDFGSALVFFIVWVGILLAAGISWRQLLALAMLAVVLGYVAWVYALAPYQKERIVAFVNPAHDPRGSGYNLIQSRIAIGAGGWFGTGFGKGTQTQLKFLPEPHNDFVFAAFTEQFGFAGAAALIAAIFFALSRVIRIGSRVRSNFARLFVVGFSLYVFSHVFISAATNVGLLPITGIPFSLMSAGGSHLMVTLFGFGVVQGMKRYG